MSPQDLHRDSIVFDGHCDTLLEILDGRRPFGERSTKGHIDLPRLREGGVTAQVFAVYLEDKFLPASAVKQTLRILDVLFRELQAHPDDFALATCAADIEAAKASGKVAAVIGIEGAEALEGDLGVLRMLYRLGVRLLTVTWSRRNQAADGGYEMRTGGGLTEFGVKLVQECNQLGIILDISHLAPAGVRDVLELCRQPVVASHSNSRALCSHWRGLDDEQLRALAATGGVAGVTFVPAFLADDRKEANLERLLDHVDHMAGVAGIDHVGLGSDFDGFHPPAPKGLEDVTRLPAITEGLVRRGYSDDDVRKVLGGNWLRVLRQVAG
jgi:membrane dipeptidase